MTARLVILASGGGTNCQALLDACATGDLDAQVVAVVTNRPGAGVVDRAARASVGVHVVDHAGREPEERRNDDRRLIEVLRSCGPDLVVLAGWMRILGAEVGATFSMINLHPAKPGEFPGVGAIERAYQAWQRGEIDESGVMVHWVPDAGVDTGPVIAVRSVGFDPGDSFEDFAARMHRVEHQLIVEATRTALATMRDK